MWMNVTVTPVRMEVTVTTTFIGSGVNVVTTGPAGRAAGVSIFLSDEPSLTNQNT